MCGAGKRGSAARTDVDCSLLDVRERQDARENAIGVEIFACKLPRGERMSGIVSLNRLEAPRRALEVSIGEQPQPDREMPTEAGILHHHRPRAGVDRAEQHGIDDEAPEGIDEPQVRRGD